ncbi:Chromosome segregation protein Spo0J, contains ParB-like nuclease domain [Tranquillimonas rosea]|uniref:Chromosome segregation protein Spo0J, contains ParB-like nuclease domain n=1 Tax=Tranquillimonas rosea TaxID=641238 RepID=A0A1H9WYR8_9RHOB|nr:ParB N-terminal domain-containing protein [Tranquillimonas rosea]SES39098.1 Chromosome segregation protein Spo0J, contains ParB-like nuclease domain [Tranquillimonas rosea]
MAKRKRLSPTPATRAPQEGPDAAARAPGMAAGVLGQGPRRAAPIADVAGEAAAASAADEMAEALRAAREEGRMVLPLPLDEIDAGYLVRDRLASDEDEMAALMDSLRARGQQTPIEVTRLDSGRYGLISGWRRLTALRRLRDETGEARFGTVLALLRRPDQAADAYLAMVEENEIRVGLSYYERARIVVKAVEHGVFPDEATALRDLFAAASRSRRSKIGSFLSIVHALDGVLCFPEAMGERAGLKLAKAIEDEPGFGPAVRSELTAQPAASPDEEQARLAAAVSPPKPRRPAPTRSEPAPGIALLSHADGSVSIEGDRVDRAFRLRLERWLKDDVQRR